MLDLKKLDTIRYWYIHLPIFGVLFKLRPSQPWTWPQGISLQLKGAETEKEVWRWIGSTGGDGPEERCASAAMAQDTSTMGKIR
jgi:hypothetical protein